MGYEPSFRAQLITRRTYNRPLNEDGTLFETWEQTVDRVIDHQQWLWERAKGDDLDAKEHQELDALRQLMLDRKAVVSGRTLWLGGTAIAKAREASQFNPLREDTKFITSDGVMSFEDFEDGDETLVLTHEGNWKRATVAYAGVRPLLKLKLTKQRSTTSIDSCLNHTWIKKSGERVLASDLKIGDQLYASPQEDFYDWDFDTANPDEQLWWCYGFVFGDGSVSKSGNSATSRVRLCGAKAQFLSRFEACGFDYSFPPSCGEDPFVYTGHYLKTLPEEGQSHELIKSFLHGYLAADGNKKNRRGSIVYTGISTKDQEAAEFLTRWLPVFGVYISDVKQQTSETNFGEIEDFTISFLYSGNTVWTVTGLEDGGQAPTWCLTVDDDHSFVLPNGVVTGNCSFVQVDDVYSVVDSFWLLLQGCGVGFRPIVGILNGFTKAPAEIEVIRSTRTVEQWERGERGNDKNTETFRKGVWHLKIGDSAEAWAKSVGKLLAQKKPFKKLILDFSEIRAPGIRLKGYGWISSGDETFSKALVAIAKILANRAGNLLTRVDLLDIMNWLGTTLSSRRAAEICVFVVDEPEAEELALAKREYWVDNPQRGMSNNTMLFYQKPSRLELKGLFQQMIDAGGSEPGFGNGAAASKRGPWFKGFNPCAEILLGDKSFCNLVEIDWGKFLDDFDGLLEAIRLAARANYRQTCVNLKDGVLSESWHELNEFLRLCGVGATGIVKWLDTRFLHSKTEIANKLRSMRVMAAAGANSMAHELGLPWPKAVTTIKPSGTLSKIMDTTEGCHRPLGKYIFNNVQFSKYDPLVEKLRAANYHMFENPYDSSGMVIRLPVAYEDVQFTKVGDLEINTETAIDQLERYKLLMDNYVDHNCSITVSYDPSEVPEIIDWLDKNWDSYVGVSWLFRNDPTKTAADLGHPYLPQEVVTKEVFDEYVATLLPVNIDEANFEDLIDDACSTGACPVR